MAEQQELDKKKAKILSLTTVFLSELGRERASRAVTLESSLQRDLGIDSLGRVELFHRLEKSFNVSLPEAAMAQSETLADILKVILEAKPAEEVAKKIHIHHAEATVYDPSEASTLVEVLLKRAATEPNRPHVTYQDEKGAEKVITYGELFTKASQISAGLLECDIEPGETIAIMLPTSEDFFYTFFAILLVGAIPVPIYPPFRPDRIEEYAMRAANILKNAQVRLLVTFDRAERLSELLSIFISSLKAVVTVDVLRKPNTIAPMEIKTTMPALIQYTSGSTSLPKGVLLTHQNLLANIKAIGHVIDIKPTDVGVSWLPLYHDMGLIGSWLMSFYYGNPIIIMSPFSFLSHPERWLWTIHYHRATLSAAPNFAYELCLRRIEPAAIEGLDLSSWRLAFNGAEAVNPKTIEGFIKKFSPYGFKPQTMYPVYGLAESTVALAFPPLNREPKVDTIDRAAFERDRKSIPVKNREKNTLQFVSCGTAIPQHAMRIVDEAGKELAERMVGNLQFKGPSSMVGYYHQEKATTEIYHEGWLDSGDLAYLADGEIYITGRKKDLIIKAGRNIHPEEIEEVTCQVAGVRKGCVIAFGVNDPKWGTEKLVIVAETKEANSVLKNKIKSEIFKKNALALGLPPDEVILVPPQTVPKTSSGKLQRSACKQAYLEKKLSDSRWPVWFQLIKVFGKGLKNKLFQWIEMALRACYSLYVGLVVLLSLPVIGLCLCLPPKFGMQLCRQWARKATRLIGCPIAVDNEINLPSKMKPLVYVANHTSYFDAIILLAALPAGVQFVGKKELLNTPVLSSLFKRFQYISVDRLDFINNLSDTQKVAECLKEEKQIVFFPEGTFTYATGLRPFKLGAFKVAVDTASPICPVAIKGARNIWRGNSLLLRPGRIIVTIGDIIFPQNHEWQEVIRLHNIARGFIAQHCGELPLDY